MTRPQTFGHVGIGALLIAGLTFFPGETRAQSSTASDVAPADTAQDAGSTIDRGKMRLNLLITLVENELKEATLKQSRLTVEGAKLDQERRKLLAVPSSGSQAEQRQLDVLEKRLGQIDEEMAEVNGRLPEIEAELAELQARLDEANGVVREPEVETVVNGNGVDEAGQWLDNKRRVQEALVYLGGYNALIDGDFGPRTQEAVRVYQKQQNIAQTGTLTKEQEAALLEQADVLRARYGMTTIEDTERGYRVSYPSGLLPDDEAIEPNGRRYVSTDGEGELVLTSIGTGGESGPAALSALYDELLGDYEVQYRRKRDDWFVVAGLIEEGRIVYDTARLKGDGVIRARLTYPAEWRDLWSPFAVIMFNSFQSVSSGES